MFRYSVLPLLSLLFLISTWADSLPSFDNRQDFADSERGFIAPLPNGGTLMASGEEVWNLQSYDFIQGECPSTVNPSLWRQGQLLIKSGLFQVTDGIYQVRGADLSNMTIIEGKTGIIVVDTLVTEETARAALDLYYAHRPKRPIKAIIYTHSHIDHFGGVRGIATDHKIEIIAPEGFVTAALTENVMAGNAMGRRASYMYGSLLPPGPKGQMTSGLGLTTSKGTTSLLLPTRTVSKTGQKMKIDGITFVFLMAPNSEAPAEMLFYLPEMRALCSAEDATHTMHNLYSLRGAKIRDAHAWAHYLDEAIALFGVKSDVVFCQHHWPIWGGARIVDFLEKQRDLYKYIHDQSLRLANQGYTMLEIAEMIQLPPSLSNEWYNRGYYGSLSHNAKSIYCYYLGWFDGNPANLNPLPPVEASLKMVEYMGGADVLLAKAQKDFDLGHYRWTAQVLNYLVFAEPQNQKARELLAATHQKLGFACENATWRNFYLTAAQELLHGIEKKGTGPIASPDIIAAMPIESLIDYLAIHLDGLKAAEHPLSFAFELRDPHERLKLEVKNGVLHYAPFKKGEKVDALVSMKRSDFNEVLLGKIPLEEAVARQKIMIEGDREVLKLFLSLLDPFEFWFKIVEPNAQEPGPTPTP